MWRRAHNVHNWRGRPEFYIPREEWWDQQAQIIIQTLDGEVSAEKDYRQLHSAAVHHMKSARGPKGHLISTSLPSPHPSDHAIVFLFITMIYRLTWMAQDQSLSFKKEILALLTLCYGDAHRLWKLRDVYTNVDLNIHLYTSLCSARLLVNSFQEHISRQEEEKATAAAVEAKRLRDIRIKEEEYAREQKLRVQRYNAASARLHQQYHNKCKATVIIARAITCALRRWAVQKAITKRMDRRKLCRGASEYAKKIKAQPQWRTNQVNNNTITENRTFGIYFGLYFWEGIFLLWEGIL